MKTVIVLGDGMSDRPVAALGGKTPLMVARKPHIDRIARQGQCGLFKSIPDGMPNGSAVANLSVLGYDPRDCFKGRGVLEAASMNVSLGPADVALRCNLITVDAAKKIVNHSAGHISNAEAAELMSSLETAFGGGRGDFPIRFYSGVSYRHLVVLEGGWADERVACAPPHDFVGHSVEALLPSASHPGAEETAARLKKLHLDAAELLRDHPVNRRRRERGVPDASYIWTWSPGTRPNMDTLETRYGKTGAVISAVDLVQGLGVLAGMEKIVVDGATGLHDTNYEGKAAAAIDALKRHDVVYVHVEATDEAGHEKDLPLKIKCIEYLDSRLVAPILKGVADAAMDVIVAVLPDHPTPVETGAHASDPVPVAIWDPRKSPDSVVGYDEIQVQNGQLGTLEGSAFFRLALGLEVLS